MREITEEAVRMLATVDTTDECQVVLRLRKRKTVLTPGQAKEIGKALLAAELDAMAMRNALDRDRAERIMARPKSPWEVDEVRDVRAVEATRKEGV